MGGRQFLFLQGLAGPFFSRLGEALAAAGFGVHRVNFHGGDKLFWRQGGAVDYRGGLARWPAFLETLLAERAITDVVLFGDCRPLHRAAIEVANAHGIQIHVFEEGYLRPDFVTVEAGGVNGHSDLPRDPEYYLAAARKLAPLPPSRGVPSSFRRRAWEDVVYNVAAIAAVPLFPGYRTHRPWPILVEYLGWTLRLLRKNVAERRAAAMWGDLLAEKRPYFVFPLQLDCDYQIRVHSPFSGMQPAIDTVLSSFARTAPSDALLVVKGHPLDNGLTDWGLRTMRTAEALGIADRVRFIDGLNVEQMMLGAAGLVTVNSTTGTLSLLHGVPTIVLGTAVYDVPRITSQQSLDAFWRAPHSPDMAVFDSFRRVLIDRCLIQGGYFSDEGMEMLIAGAVQRLRSAPPGSEPQLTGPKRGVAADPPPAWAVTQERLPRWRNSRA